MYLRIAVFLLVVDVLGATARVGRADSEVNILPVKFDLAALDKPPEVFATDDFKAEGTRAFFYEGQDRKWESAAATIDAGQKKVTGQLPAGATVYYFNIFDDLNCAVSSMHEAIEKSDR